MMRRDFQYHKEIHEKFECVVSFANLFSALKITKACFLSTNILFLQRVVGGTGFDEVL